MTQPQKLSNDSRPNIASDEWILRIELAAAYRLADYFGWCELIYGHFTAHVPGEGPHFLINPYGLNYDEITASNLVKIDIHGTAAAPTDYPINHAGFIIHSAIHSMKTVDNQIVMHTHSQSGMAVAALKSGLLPISMNATVFFENIGYHDYEGPSLYLEEQERLRQSLGNNKAMILRNHGLLTVGRTVSEAFIRLYRLEQACRIQLKAAGAGDVRLIDDNIARKSCTDTNNFMESESSFGQLEFAALMRKLDKFDPSYRH